MSINVFSEKLKMVKNAEINELEKRYRGRFERMMQSGFGKMDSIHLTLPELEKLCNILENMETPSAELLENPALPEFELVVVEPFPSLRKNRIRFKRTVMPGEEIIQPYKDVAFGYTPHIDGYVCQDNGDKVSFFLTLYAGHFYEKGIRADITSTTQTFHYADALLDSGIAEAIDEDYTYNLEAARYTKMAYLAIQEMMRNKPTVFVESKPGNANVVSAGGSSNGKKNKVRVERVIRINAAELEKAIKGHKEIKCPCWGVMGHYRTYKSGKRVWVNPYKKGKERNNPNAYVAKEYLMEV